MQASNHGEPELAVDRRSDSERITSRFRVFRHGGGERTDVGVGQFPPRALQAQSARPRPSKVPPETTRPSMLSNVIHLPDEPRPPAPAGATIVPATANVTAAWAWHGPLNVALDTRYRPGGT
jgi:hypothetical protein